MSYTTLWEVPDDFWEKIEGLLPREKPPPIHPCPPGVSALLAKRQPVLGIDRRDRQYRDRKRLGHQAASPGLSGGITQTV